MKIAMIGHKRIPSREGGVEIVVEELAKREAALGNEITVYNRLGHHVSGSKFDSQIKSDDLKNIKIKTVFTFENSKLNAIVYSILSAIKVSFSNCDVVHIHAEGPASMSFLPKLFGKKVIVTIHGLDWQRSKWGGFATKYIKHGEKCAVKYANEIIVLSENVKKYFKEKYDRETIFIPNGIEKPTIRKANIIKNKYNLDKDDYILFLARIVPEKGLDDLLDAYEKIKTDKKLVIAGGASHTNDYLEHIKERVKNNKNIIMTGFVQGEELDELYSNAYIYCLPSHIEGMPLSLLEAMSYKNCCLASDIDECKEVLEENGITFRKSDCEDLKIKLEDLIKDKEKVKKYKDSAQEFILNKYNWDYVVEKTFKLYKKGDK